MTKWKKLLRFSVESWESAAAVQTRASMVENFVSFAAATLNTKTAVTVPPLELFLFEVQFKGLEMTERPKHMTDTEAALQHFDGNESLSCITPFHCPMFSSVVKPYRFPGFSNGLEETRSELCRRSHGLIGMYKMVYFMAACESCGLCVRAFQAEVERRLGAQEKDFVTDFHKVGFSPKSTLVPQNASIIPSKSLCKLLWCVICAYSDGEPYCASPDRQGDEGDEIVWSANAVGFPGYANSRVLFTFVL